MITIRRTGESSSFTSNAFEVTYPDGTAEILWSPPWHEMSKTEEESKALSIAKEKWEAKCKKE